MLELKLVHNYFQSSKAMVGSKTWPRMAFPGELASREKARTKAVRFSFRLAILLILATILPHAAFAQPAEEGGLAGIYLVKAETVHLGNGEVLAPGMVLVQDGKIAAVGASLETPAGVKTISVRCLIPGLIDAASNVGLTGGDAEITNEVTPDFETRTSVDYRDLGFRKMVDAGVTTLNLVPGTDNVIAGFSCVVKSFGEKEERVIRDRNGMIFSMCSDPASRNSSRSRPDSIYIRQPTNRMGVVWILRSRLQKATESTAGVTAATNSDAAENQATGNRATGSQATTSQAAVSAYPVADQLLAEMLDGQHQAFGVSRTSYDILSLLTIAEEFKFAPILIGGDESYKVLDVLAQKNVPVIYTALSISDRGAEGTELSWGTPLRLSESKIPFCLAGDNLLTQARFAVRFGLEPSVALASITSAPAAILKISDRVGSIAVGKDADLVALDGEALQFTSSIQWTMVNGKLLSNEGDDE